MGMDPLISWFRSHGGAFDDSAMGFSSIKGQGWGAVALRDLSEGHVLFTIPRDLTLSTHTCTLPELFGHSEWQKYNLHTGWAGLMLCMMWEEAQGSSSKWSEYLAFLPTAFDTPMFWSESDLEELKGTSMGADKIGRDGAENDYREKVIPALRSRPDLFGADPSTRFYSLANYHLMGSRILSRSFLVEKWDGKDEEDDTEGPDNTTSMDMDVDEPPAVSIPAAEGGTETEEEPLLDGKDSDSDDENDPTDIAMVPMADMLNARYESENAKLFYEQRDLRMVTTKAISTGEQIWNTYGDPPNSDLLRRYGHVDLIPLAEGGLGNPADIVDIRADIVVNSVSELGLSQSPQSSAERVDWWLEECDDDGFVLEMNYELPNELISFVRLLLLPVSEWSKIRVKSRLPKAKIDDKILSVAINVLKRRIAEYSTTYEEDERLLSENSVASGLSTNKRHSVIVRLGEKRILRGALSKVQERLESATSSAAGVKEQSKKKENG
ncbi:hypothetical protein EW146_g2289 [Bondarzewia mesenterica]|uniref:Ribosomal lysine N-methyltransferase 4 n=1 Tax=Bondarzewia mesenterica TaxID=1095465 RepID=A0A4S4M134_9AGAM|nr:hypothetical protein EW146_g2289 [Bondarzewia mesenterica]